MVYKAHENYRYLLIPNHENYSYNYHKPVREIGVINAPNGGPPHFVCPVCPFFSEFCIHFLAVLATAGNPSAIGDTGGGPARTADYRIDAALKRAAGSSRECAASAATMTRKTSTRRAWVVTDMS